MSNCIRKINEFHEPLLADKVKLKYKFMTENIFRFFRATCHLFYDHWSQVAASHPAPLAWICGDLHIENFGSYKAANRMVYFDLNDFDEAILAPATWEVVRCVCSIFAAFDALNIAPGKAERIARHFLRSYSATLAEGKALSIDPRTANGIVSTFLETVDCRRRKDLLRKKTTQHGTVTKLRPEHPKHHELDKKLKKELFDHIGQWLEMNHESPCNYKVVDGVFRIAGTGSIGLKRYAFLLKSRNRADKYMLLDMKQVRASSLLPYVNNLQPQFDTDAQRVIDIQKRMQHVSPALLSVTGFNGNLYLLQEMQYKKDNIDFRLIKNRYRDMYQVIGDMGMLTASAQLRSSGRDGSATADELIAFGKDKQWQTGILKYAREYLPQLKKDYQAFKQHIDKPGKRGEDFYKKQKAS